MEQYGFSLTTVALYQCASENTEASKKLQEDVLFGPSYKFWISLTEEQKENVLSVIAGPLTTKYHHVVAYGNKNGRTDTDELKSELKKIEEEYEVIVTVIHKKK